MRRILFAILMLGCAEAQAQTDEWQPCGQGIKERDVRAVAVGPSNASYLYAGTDKAVYRSEDAGKSWREALALKGTYKAVNAIAIDPKDNNIAYVSTENGVFKTADLGKTWKKIFDGKGDFEKNVRHVAIDPEDNNSIYIATQSGIFSSPDAGNSWQKATSLTSTAINYVAIRHKSPVVLFAGSATGVFLSKDNGLSWERIFVSSEAKEEKASGEYDSDGSEDNSDETASVSGVNCITLDPIDDKKMYLGTSGGVYISADFGASYRKMPSSGLTDENINDILITNGGRIYASSNGGVFEYYPLDERWDGLYKGTLKGASHEIAYSQDANLLYGAFDGGLFKAAFKSQATHYAAERNKKELLSKLSNEPTIQKVQKVAMRYADCGPDKIALWRVGAQARAFMPKVKFGLDRSRGSNIDVDRGGTNDPDRFMDGPWDSNRGWDASVEWDFGDMIWNPDQTNIDVRSRLTTQLRDDIMDDVTRSYFERKRLLIELAQRPPQDIKLKEEKELRVEELTANIDGLTGGYFSKEIAKSSKEK